MHIKNLLSLLLISSFCFGAGAYKDKLERPMTASYPKNSRECGICRNRMDAKNRGHVILPCGTAKTSHSFCTRCFTKWTLVKQQSVSCPLCRNFILPIEDRVISLEEHKQNAQAEARQARICRRQICMSGIIAYTVSGFIVPTLFFIHTINKNSSC
jgi:hypothetical protein